MKFLFGLLLISFSSSCVLSCLFDSRRRNSIEAISPLSQQPKAWSSPSFMIVTAKLWHEDDEECNGWRSHDDQEAARRYEKRRVMRGETCNMILLRSQKPRFNFAEICGMIRVRVWSRRQSSWSPSISSLMEAFRPDLGKMMEIAAPESSSCLVPSCPRQLDPWLLDALPSS